MYILYFHPAKYGYTVQYMGTSIIDLEDTKPTFFFHIILSALTLYAPKRARWRAVKP